MSLSVSSTLSKIAIDRAFAAGLLGSVLVHAGAITALGTVRLGVERAPIEVHLVEFTPPRAEMPPVKPREPRKAIAVPEAIKPLPVPEPERAAAAPPEPPPQRTESRVSVVTVTPRLPERVLAPTAQRPATEEQEPPSLQIPRAGRAARPIAQAPSSARLDRPLEQLPLATVLASPDVAPLPGKVERRVEPLPGGIKRKPDQPIAPVAEPSRSPRLSESAAPLPGRAERTADSHLTTLLASRERDSDPSAPVSRAASVVVEAAPAVSASLAPVAPRPPAAVQPAEPVQPAPSMASSARPPAPAAVAAAPPAVVARVPGPPPPSSPSHPPQVAVPASPAPAAAGGGQLHAAIPPATRDGGAFTAPRLTRQKKPRYPEAARQAGAEGTVLVKAFVRADGTVKEAEVKRSAGSPALDRAALDTIRDSRFVPAERGGKPVAVWVEIPIDFRLER